MTGPRQSSTVTKEAPSNGKLSSSFLSRSIFVAGLSIAAFFILRWPLFNNLISLRSLDTYALCSPDGTENIYTVDSASSRVQCIAVHNSIITSTGSIEHVKRRWQDITAASSSFSKLRGPLSVRYIKPGAIVLPGLSDSHAHILEYGSTLQLPLEGTKTINGLLI
jgi:hypothetical protein